MSVFQFPFFAPGGITSSTTHNADGSEQTPRYSFGFLGITRVQDVFRDPRSCYFITCLDFCWPPKNSQVYFFPLRNYEKILYYWNLLILGGFWLKGSFRWVRLPSRFRFAKAHVPPAAPRRRTRGKRPRPRWNLPYRGRPTCSQWSCSLRMSELLVSGGVTIVSWKTLFRGLTNQLIGVKYSYILLNICAIGSINSHYFPYDRG